MVELTSDLIVTAPNDQQGATAIQDLTTRGPEDLGCRYQESLSSRLAGLETSSRLQSLPYTFHRISVRHGDERGAANRILRLYDGEGSDRGRIEAVEPNQTLAPSAPYLGLPFKLGGKHADYLKLMKVGDAHHDGVKGSGLRIAIVDSGLDSFVGVKAADFYDLEVANPVHAGLSKMTDNDGHGTAMASLATAVAPEADIYIVRVMDQGGLFLWNVLAGVGVAAYDCNADIISLSLGFDTFAVCGVCGATGTARSVALEKMLNGITASLNKLVYVASTGNESATDSINYPAAYDTAVPVGSVNNNGDRSSFSNYNQKKTHKRHIMAPGGEKTAANVVSEDVGTGGTTKCCGTSAATAYAAGMMALLRSDTKGGYDKLDREAFLDKVITNNCTLGASHPKAEYGAGLIQYVRASASKDDSDDNSNTAKAEVRRYPDRVEIISRAKVSVPVNRSVRSRFRM